MLGFFLCTFYNERGSYLIFLSLLYIGFVINKYYNNLIKEPMDLFNLLVLLLVTSEFLFFIIYRRFYGSKIFSDRINTINRFKKIMSQSEEGIVIFKDKNTIEYLNDKFI
jgi:hypothetical protein